jgi:hypothetical protein
MSRFLLSGLALGLGLATVSVAQDSSRDSVKGSLVTITGCVATGKEDSFVLTGVEEISGPTSTGPNATLDAMAGLKGGAPGVIYWLSSDSVKLMRGHLGHKVQVTGTITDVSAGTVTWKQEPGKDGPDNTVKVEARDKESSGKTDEAVVTGPESTVKKEDTQNLPVRRVKVDTVKMLAPTCR